MLQPKVIIVGDANIQGAVELRTHLPVAVTVMAGQEVHVRLRYQIEEADGSKEAYRLRLASSLGPDAPDPVEVRWGDTPLIRDDRSGTIGHRFRPTGEGLLEGHVSMEAEYISGRWSGSGEQRSDRRSAEGSLRVRVVSSHQA